MSKSRIFLLATAAASALSFAGPAAAQLVTYSWTTTSQGFGAHVDQPTFASFEVPLAAVQSGVIGYFDITNIKMAYPGLTFDAFTPSSIGLDNAAYVNPMTGALVFNNNNQGLAVIGYQGGLFSNSFLSITFGNSYSPFGVALTSVADQFNALNQGSAWAGFPTAGYWTATFPDTGGVPEPSQWALLIVGFLATGAAMRRPRKRTTGVSYS